MHRVPMVGGTQHKYHKDLQPTISTTVTVGLQRVLCNRCSTEAVGSSLVFSSQPQLYRLPRRCFYAHKQLRCANRAAIGRVHSTYPDDVKRKSLQHQLEKVGIVMDLEGMQRGAWQAHDDLCPKCRGGSKEEPAFRTMLDADSWLVHFKCFRATCGYTGYATPSNVTETVQSGYYNPEAAVASGMPSAGVGSSSPSAQGTSRSWAKPLGSTFHRHAPASRQPLDDDLLVLFAQLGISRATLERYKVCQQLSYRPKKDGATRCIVYPYYMGNEEVNATYQSVEDGITWQVAGREKMCYGLDDARAALERGDTKIILVETEIDKLSLAEVGIFNVVALYHKARRQLLKTLEAAEKAAANPDKAWKAAGSGSSDVDQQGGRGGRATSGVYPRHSSVGSAAAGRFSRDDGNEGDMEDSLADEDDEDGGDESLWMEHLAKILALADYIVLAVRSDMGGQRMAEELARRLGRERCEKVVWSQLDLLALPQQSTSGGSELPDSGQDGDYLVDEFGRLLDEYGQPVYQAAQVGDNQHNSLPGVQNGSEHLEHHSSLYDTNGRHVSAELQRSAGSLSEGAAAGSDPAEHLSTPAMPSNEGDVMTLPGGRGNTLEAAEQLRATALDAAGLRYMANDVLLLDGPEALRRAIEQAQKIDLPGIYEGFSSVESELLEQYLSPSGHAGGYSTGWHGVDRLYKVFPGELTIVTGIPNSGKSEWLDALALNLAQGVRSSLHVGDAQAPFLTAFCSMEKEPAHHAMQLLEKKVGKPFFMADYAHGIERMDVHELNDGLEWVNNHFLLIRDDAATSDGVTIDWILEKATTAVIRYGIQGLVIDPYNELDHNRDKRTTETEYISKLLSKVKQFAQKFRVHIWFVAHPRQMKRAGSPNLYDISGSANWVNKADVGLVVHRPSRDDPNFDPATVMVKVLKVRNKMAGRAGDCFLRYNVVNGRYEDEGSMIRSLPSGTGTPPPPGLIVDRPSWMRAGRA